MPHHDILDPEKTTTSKYPTALFWNRAGLGIMIFFMLLGIGTCQAINGVPVVEHEEYVSPIVAGTRA